MLVIAGLLHEKCDHPTRAKICTAMAQYAGLKRSIKAFIHKGESYYVAECLEISVVTQGRTLDETIANLEEAVCLHLEGEDLSELGLAPNPTLLATLELEPSPRVA
jgi:predicted RNase H-like HicB family nuclease